MNSQKMHNNSLSIAKETLLTPGGITEKHLEKVLHGMLGLSIDSADLYFQSTINESWVLEDSKIKQGSFSAERGVGARAVSGEKAGFAYSDDIILPALQQAASAAGTIARLGQTRLPTKTHDSKLVKPCFYSDANPLNSLKTSEKLNLLKQLDSYARSLDARITQVKMSLHGSYEVVLIVNSDGTFATDIRPLVRLNVNIIVEENGKREQGFAGGGGRFGYEYFNQFDNDISQAEHYAKEAVRQALVNLEAIPAPAGAMTVVLGPGWPGVLLHEAVGHGLEGDFNRKGSSVFSGRVGEQVASSKCTIIDDGTLVNRRGSLNIDDEGTPTQRNVLIENGILLGYMQDKMNAKLMKVAPTGNGRRESYACLPMPRMTNTFMLSGEHDPHEIISSVKNGLYAVNFGGGQVDITSGKFVFSACEAYLIKNGKITHPVKGATLIGDGPKILQHISMVGNDLRLDTGVGVCGKDGQSVPVGVGQPTLKVDNLTIGGTQAT